MFNGTSTLHGLFANWGGKKLAWAFKVCQQYTMHITLYVTQVCNTIHRNTHKLQNRNNWLSNRKTYLLIYNAGVFTFTKPDNTYILFSINSLWCGCISTLRPEICKPDLSCILHYHWYLNKRNSRRCVTYLLQGNQSCRNFHHSTKGTAEH